MSSNSKPLDHAGNVVSRRSAGRSCRPGLAGKFPASVPRMPTATISASGRRYRGLSAEERRADQRERLVRAAINEFSARGYHRTSVEDIVRSAHTSRTAFYAFFDNREAAMYAALASVVARVCSTSVRTRPRATPGPTRACIEVGVTAFVELPRVRSRPRRASCCSRASARRPRSTRCARQVRCQVATQVCEIWADYDPEAAASPQASAVAVGVFGLLLESMLHLVESDRLDEAPAHVPALVDRGRADARPRRLSDPPA